MGQEGQSQRRPDGEASVVICQGRETMRGREVWSSCVAGFAMMEAALSQGMLGLLEARKGKKTLLPREPPKGVQVCCHFDYSPLISDFQPLELLTQYIYVILSH